MSIFDHWASKSMSEQEKNTASPTPYRRLSSELDEAGEHTKAQYPDDSRTVDDFVRFLKDICKSRRKKMPGSAQPIRAEARFFLSKDRMRAYACLLPPENNGDGITLDEFLDVMHFEGIHHGILQEEIQQEFQRGYLRIFLVAQGSLPQAGEDGKVTELFHRNRNMCLDEQQVDFSQDIQQQPIRKGTVICLIRPPKAGTDGMDVTGQLLPCPQPAGVDIPQGKNTDIIRNGQALAAGVDGILYIENDRFCIHEQRIIDGDLNQFQGKLRISGNLYVGGNVDRGSNVEATGDIVINGKVGEAQVISTGGSIRVQQGIYGVKDKTVLSAARQVQAPVVEWAKIDAGDSVTAEMISNSTICCNGTVRALTGRGMIAGSLIQAGGSILCLRIGNLAGDRSRFSVGYPPHSPESWNRVRTELAEVQSTINKLWTTITDLRKKGFRLSEAEQAVLAQLVEQRDLYEKKRISLTTEMNALNELLTKKSSGSIQCEKLRPFLEVQIGRLTEEITTVEENCNIHAVENRIYLK